MIFHPTLQWPDPRLHEVAAPVDLVKQPAEEFHELVKVTQMVMAFSRVSTLVLAAPLVGLNKRIIITAVANEDSTKYSVLTNPKIVESYDVEDQCEQCLAVPLVTHMQVPRAKRVVVEGYVLAFPEEGAPQLSLQELEYRGQLAFDIQHEIEHLDGKLLMDRMGKLKRQQIRKDHEKRRQASKSPVYEQWDTFEQLYSMADDQLRANVIFRKMEALCRERGFDRYDPRFFQQVEEMWKELEGEGAVYMDMMAFYGSTVPPQLHHGLLRNVGKAASDAHRTTMLINAEANRLAHALKTYLEDSTYDVDISQIHLTPPKNTKDPYYFKMVVNGHPFSFGINQIPGQPLSSSLGPTFLEAVEKFAMEHPTPGAAAFPYPIVKGDGAMALFRAMVSSLDPGDITYFEALPAVPGEGTRFVIDTKNGRLEHQFKHPEGVDTNDEVKGQENIQGLLHALGLILKW